MFRKIFTSFALIAMLLLCFAFSPPDVSAKTAPSAEKHLPAFAIAAQNAPVSVFRFLRKTAVPFGNADTNFVTAPNVAHIYDSKGIILQKESSTYYEPPNLLKNNQPNQFNFNVPEIVPLR